MQSSAVPELAHTHARPIHWVATATAVAGVVALSSVLQPGHATAAAPGAPHTRSAPAQALPPDPADVEDFDVRGGDVVATLLGYSSGDVPRCCPDVRETVKWRWENGAFVRSAPSDARSV